MIRLLFLCTGNSARSILAEALTNARGGGRLTAASAGSQPKGAPHPLAIETPKNKGIPAEGLSSKSWDVFGETGAAAFDAVITVCDSAAAEVCPVWPGAPLTAHWGLPDPAAIEDTDKARAAFEDVFVSLEAKIAALLAQPLEALDREGLRTALNAAGEAGPL